MQTGPGPPGGLPGTTTRSPASARGGERLAFGERYSQGEQWEGLEMKRARQDRQMSNLGVTRICRLVFSRTGHESSAAIRTKARCHQGTNSPRVTQLHPTRAPGLPAPRHEPAQRQRGGEEINETLPSDRCERLLVPTNLYAVLGCSLTTIWVTQNSFSSSQASCCSAP